MVDDQGVLVSCPKATLQPGESMDCTASATAENLNATSFTTVPGLCGGFPGTPLYENMATATGETSTDAFVEDTDPSHRNPGWGRLSRDRRPQSRARGRQPLHRRRTGRCEHRPADEALAVCGCPDFYRITISDGVYAENLVRNDDGSIDPSSLNRTDVIYEVLGYIEGGNLQIHRPTGKDLR